VDVVADFGNAGDYLKEINIDLKDDKRNTGPTAIAVLTERHKISNNILLDDNMTPWHKGALKYGYKSSASFPLIVNQKVIGVFNLYSCDTDFFQEDDIKLLDEIAIDISFAFEFSEIEVEKKRIEDTLKESEKKYRTLIQKIQSAVVVHGVDTKIITCNAKAQELLGLSEDQLLGKTAIDPGWHFYREDRTIASLEGYPVNCVITSRKALRNEIYGIHRPNNKNDVWVLVNADPVFDNNGNLVQIIVTFNDITERKHIEEALQSSKAELSALINSMTDVLIVVSSEGRYMKIAETNPSLLYKPPKELLGKTLHEVFSREQADKFLKYVKEALYNAKPINFEYSLLIEEKEFWFNATVSPMSEDSVLLVAKDITERKSMEVALSKGEERFRMVFENSPVSIWEENFSEIKNLFDSLKKINITDIENYFNSYPEILIQCAEKVKITDVNSAALSLHEASTKQELVENLANTFTNESFIAFRKELVCLWNGGTKMQVEASVKTLAGKPRNVSVYFSVCPGYEDTLSKVIVSLIDITDRKQAENALKESERRYRDIFDNILDGLYLLELTKEGHFKTIEVNPALERLTGIPRSFSVGKIQEEIVPVEVAEIVNNKYRKCIQLNQAIEEIVTLDLPVGKRIFSSTLIPATDINENIYRIVGISRDITNIREVEQKLNLLNFALNNVYDEAYLINEKSGFDYVNDECCKALGYSKVELLEMSVSDIDPDFPFERWQEHWNFIMQHGSMVFESLHKTKEGKIYPVEISANYFEYNGKGYNLAMCRNISERKIAEAEIKKLNQELEKRVIERTSQLEIANKELEAFAYSVSHDLRAPLRGIDGFSQVLLNEYKDKIDDQGRNYLQRVCSAAQRMAQLIDDILSLSRVSRSEMDIRLVNLSGLAKEIAGNLMEMQPDRKVEFVIEEGIEAKGDSRLLRIVLENLLGNAWKFTSKHPKACIEFRLLQLDRKPVYLIRDDGAGFQMDFVPKLFGAFQRLHDSNEFPGTGIGLATVQRIIHRHGGEVWAKGEVEKGAEFYFTLS
jgi:PAS domain S-box-containing protein